MITKKIVIFIGMPGSGKSTQGRLLSKKISIPHLSAGKLLKSFLRSIDSDSLQSQELNSKILNGNLIPDDLMNRLMMDHFISDKCNNGFILDGYPRTVMQAEYFINQNVLDTEPIVVVFDISIELLKKRILGRYICNLCGALYNSYFCNTIINNKCDYCNSNDFILRNDDNDYSITNRVNSYKNDTSFLLDYCHKYLKCFNVNANLTQEQLSLEINGIIESV
ncbi:adenylate kinase family protein [Rickettsia endosymbiont of Cardiosporidium cionae]|uniref:adenylate kinase family protein n=1 Tax=Rickettsia endosymbiont of Cardiosporidium cionae TaxID=2777155 RepID=UPI0018936C7B|nr:nucleoside monophosphate kinase [Rickettsia endosymbiont of Cardiosporidium cionae]KAF8818182.1 adenylate kinase [Rickettsia endosymbiont of Cardiosporidium cionae]